MDDDNFVFVKHMDRIEAAMLPEVFAFRSIASAFEREAEWGLPVSTKFKCFTSKKKT